MDRYEPKQIILIGNFNIHELSRKVLSHNEYYDRSIFLDYIIIIRGIFKSFLNFKIYDFKVECFKRVYFELISQT